MNADSSSLLTPNEDFHKSVTRMVDLAEKQGVTEREKKHVNAVKLLAEGWGTDIPVCLEVFERYSLLHIDYINVKI